MIVLDTHVWAWWASSPERLSPGAREVIEGAAAIGVPAICLWEIAMLVAHGRLAFDRPVDVWLDQGLALPRVRLLPLDPAVAVRVADLAEEMHGDPADRMIVATALVARAPLVTKDRRIHESGVVSAIW